MIYGFVGVVVFLLSLLVLPKPTRWQDMAAAGGVALLFVVGMVML